LTGGRKASVHPFIRLIGESSSLPFKNFSFHQKKLTLNSIGLKRIVNQKKEKL
jgi:hypothetical protein